MKSSQIKTLDKLFAHLIQLRSNGYCEYCHKYVKLEGINPSHFHGRRMKSVRWDEDNVHGICTPCHQAFHNNFCTYITWVEKRLGEERYDDLLSRAVNITKLDYEDVKAQIQNRIKEIECTR
jgi:hypothetical protein